MIRYPYENWLRYSFGIMAFVMALLLTPRVLLDGTEYADSHEIPVNLLDSSDECLWCDTSTQWEPARCDDDTEEDHHILHPDSIHIDGLYAPCRNDLTMEDPST